MNNDHSLPSKANTTLIMELSAVIQPGLRKVEEALALACETGAESYWDQLLTAKERLAEINTNLEKLIADYGKQTPPNDSKENQLSAPDALSHPAKERILYAPHARQHRRQYMKILLVEDSPVSNAITKAMLEQQGWRVSGVLSGQEALEKLMAKSTYDLIITDLMMDNMNGLDLAREIRKLERQDTNTLAHIREGRPPIPIIAITANDNQATPGEYLEAGINDMVFKSTSLESLIASIEKQIDKASAL
ncbi:MAG TPA: hypothetical protein DEQ20_05670 [Desulfobulbaceae bacterium]|nr:MAG: hypothetical protein A2520_07170 [Deltaproteobacteria bacterium RIFOXYD12_FULL_53_23]HCC54398.1 hypothetical protein [Desulfobulbaceae bacterium]